MNKKIKETTKAWACLTNPEWVNSHEQTLAPCGNGNQFQYPIFPTRKEAHAFIKEIHGYNKILPCTITLQVKKKKR